MGDGDEAQNGLEVDTARPDATSDDRIPAGVLAVFDASPVPTAITRAADGAILFANRACLEMLGWQEAGLVGRTMVEVGFWARPEQRAEMLAQLAAGRPVRNREQTVTTRRGDARIVLTSISPLRLAGEDCLVGHIHDITEQRQLEEQLRESAARFRQLTETIEQAFVLANVDPPQVLYASPAVARIFGFDPSVLYSNPLAIQELIHVDDRDRVLIDRGRMTHATDFEFRIVRPDGATRWIRSRAEAVRRDGGQVARIASVSEDITDDRALREALRASEERFRMMVESVQDYAILMLDVEGRVATWNAGAQRFKGYAADEIIGRHFSVFYPADAVAAGKPELELAMARAEGRMEDHGWRVRKDGTRFWANVVITALRADDGALLGYGKVTRDLTERRAAELELRESEERFRLLAESSTDLITRTAPDGTLRYVSPASKSLFGYEPEEMLGRSGREHVHPDDIALLDDDLASSSGASDEATTEFRVRRKDGSHVWVQTKIRILRDPVSGEVLELHGSSRDVSERKQVDAALRIAKEEAERANSAKSEFLSRMSHELRTPLHAILGFGELLGREQTTVEQGDYVDHMVKAGRHLLEMINEVLDLSRIESGELGLSLEPVHIGQLAREVLDIVRPMIAARSLAVALPALDAADVHVLADRQRLKQVLLNILSNAIKYNRAGGAIGLTVADAGDSIARIEVTDTGIGIAATDIDRVFVAFDRLGAEATDVEGSGLGLALTKRMIEAMGGEIGVDSEIGRGTTFWITLPVVGEPQPQRASSVASAPVVRAPVGLPRTVLCIEDNPSNIKLVEAIMQARPEVTLLVATHGGLGLELAFEHRPDVVLLDLNLADMSGEDVLRRIRSDPRGAGTAVVIVSADATPGQITRLRSAGADDYLTKPFDLDEFLAVVDGCVRLAPAAPSEDARGPLDLVRITNLRKVYRDRQKLKEFVEFFLDDSPGRLADLTAVAAAGDAQAVRRAAHAWRGACGLVGAHRVNAHLAGIEALATVGSVADDGEIAALAEAYREAAEALVLEIQ